MSKTNLSLQEIKQLHQAGHLEEAKLAYEQWLIQQGPHAEVYNNLGTIYFSQANYQAASSAFLAAIQLKADYLEAYYNLGLALTREYKILDALNAYLSLLAIDENYHAARFQAAILYMQQEQFHQAAEHLRYLIERHPHVVEAHINLATCYLKLQQFKAAREHYQAALKLTPDDCQVLFNLGVLSMNEGAIEKAIQYYLQITRIDPQHFAAHNNLGVAYLTLKNTDMALYFFQIALNLEPDHPALRYTISVLQKTAPKEQAPAGYVKTLFDSYAEHYDAHLTLGLHYQVPQEINALLFAENLPQAAVAIDLGCGTGLCGPYLSVRAQKLIGIDLSPMMLAKAAEKKIYHELVEADLIHYLQTHPDYADLLVAADVLTYIGDLRPFFSAARNCIKSQGALIFSTEMTDAEDVLVTEAGRYAHRKSYIDELAREFNFKLLHYKVIPKRTQDGVAVLGHLYMLSNAANYDKFE